MRRASRRARTGTGRNSIKPIPANRWMCSIHLGSFPAALSSLLSLQHPRTPTQKAASTLVHNDAHGLGSEIVARITLLRADREPERHVHLRLQVHVVPGPGRGRPDLTGAIGIKTHVHEDGEFSGFCAAVPRYTELREGCGEVVATVPRMRHAVAREVRLRSAEATTRIIEADRVLDDFKHGIAADRIDDVALLEPPGLVEEIAPGHRGVLAGVIGVESHGVHDLLALDVDDADDLAGLKAQALIFHARDCVIENDLPRHACGLFVQITHDYPSSLWCGLAQVRH